MGLRVRSMLGFLMGRVGCGAAAVLGVVLAPVMERSWLKSLHDACSGNTRCITPHSRTHQLGRQSGSSWDWALTSAMRANT